MEFNVEEFNGDEDDCEDEDEGPYVGASYEGGSNTNGGSNEEGIL